MLKKIQKYFNTNLVMIYDNTKKHKNNNNKKHFTLIIISDYFLKIKMLHRHQKVYKLLYSEMKNKIHAISIYTYTINEWKNNKIQKKYNINCKFSNI